jgi:Holliday junction resolvasome RuvABC DNA-binding subunit
LPEVVGLFGDNEHTQAVDALVGLGYRKEDAAVVLRGKNGTTEELIRLGLKQLHG